jgi:hypothetical protein
MYTDDLSSEQEFRQLHKQKKLPLFDVIFTYSSVEHSGLGKSWISSIAFSTWSRDSQTDNKLALAPENVYKTCF